MHITERRALSLPRSLFSLFCSSSASLCVREETAVRYSCSASHSMKLNRMADNSVSWESLCLSACSGHRRRTVHAGYMERCKADTVSLHPPTHTRLMMPSHDTKRNISTASQDKSFNFYQFKPPSSHLEGVFKSRFLTSVIINHL